MACANHWHSKFRVGSRHLAERFVRAGYDVAYIADPISPLHLLGGVTEVLKDRFSSYRTGGRFDLEGHLWSYVPGAWITPHSKPITRTDYIHNHWADYTFPNLLKLLAKRGFDEVDLLYVDSVIQPFWVDAIRWSKSVFRLADNPSGFAKYTSATGRAVQRLARAVDLVIFSARNLEKYVKELQPKKMLYLPNGVNFSHFAHGSMQMPEEFKSIPKPIALYVGAMDNWFDYELVNFAAENLPNISFVLIGPDQLARRKLKSFANIFILGAKDYCDLPGYMYNSMVGIIPFDVQGHRDLINTIHPLKLYEYMACGLPVVSMAWLELMSLKSPAILCHNYAEFVNEISRTVSSQVNREVLINYASKANWSYRMDILLNSLGM